MKYDKHEVERIYQENLSAARQMLASLPIAQGRQPTTKGLNGWVYEQAIRHCLCEELKELGIAPTIEEQVPLHGRTKVDLLVGKVAIEIKALGIFGNDARKYRGYRSKAEENGWCYFYLTRGESYLPYRVSMQSTFGKDRAFFLDTEGDWERFVSEIIRNLRQSHNNSLHRIAKKTRR
jgi:hypothetical protein